MDVNQEINRIILKYHLDKYYPSFREKQGDKNKCFSNFIPWEDDYYDYIDSEDIDGLVGLQGLKEQRDIIVLESIRCLCELKGDIAAEKRKEYLERLFFLAIYKRNFLLAEEVFDELQQDFGTEMDIKEAWREINAIIERMKIELKNRKYEDIVSIWIDAVSYADRKEIPYLEELGKADHTISFSNAYTVTPYTNPTLLLMTTGKKRIDDQSDSIKRIDENNSETIALLKNKGYSCKFLGAYWKRIDNLYRGEREHYIYAPCSEMLWDMACHLLDASQPAFILTHIFSETHFPCLSMNQKTRSDHEKNVRGVRRLQGRQEVDRQLRYYMDFLGTSATKLFFSDHGDDWSSIDVFHTVLEVQGKNFERENIKEIFSYGKFPELFRQVILDKRINKPALISDYAEVQEIPLYNKNLIKDYIRKKFIISSVDVWGYRGVIDRDYVYLYYRESDGTKRELLMKNGCEDCFRKMCIPGYSYICNEEAVPYYREIVKGKPMADIQDEKFKYSRYLQKAAENAIPKHAHKMELLRELFSSLPAHGIAFRGGGLDNRRIFFFYKKELQGVEYIIDRSEDCQCSGLDIPIIPVEDIGKYPIHTILLSSKKFAEEFRKEAMDYPAYIQVVDVYQYLEENGIIEKYPFYYFQPDEEDYDVGFPFDD